MILVMSTSISGGKTGRRASLISSWSNRSRVRRQTHDHANGGPRALPYGPLPPMKRRVIAICGLTFGEQPSEQTSLRSGPILSKGSESESFQAPRRIIVAKVWPLRPPKWRAGVLTITLRLREAKGAIDDCDSHRVLLEYWPCAGHSCLRR